ncbi:MAG: hypothetical protein LKF87_03780 [Clostridium tyrobutyricum]|jgi:hypothetical protein|nr:hypothetical protein [Clostridium tyrobutyricum]MCH4199277.1 hypothetical protein [Clostridium tyrobutyricum]MCH4236609.1 hypothetical protein [Clostridium tyrobutyricum]MCH4258075.1 hypothetical protein [Clostridium tyrobutyricum]MCI1239114.1 hypothetical protein [Clostridium tyrobutyricum]MCI1651414.1 hypothetical protein [Clostridium tyrobutyricum]
MDIEKIENMNEDDVIETLLGANKIPERTVVIQRIGIPVKLKALTGKQISKIRKDNTHAEKIKGTKLEKNVFDDENFNVELIEKATISPNWNNPKLKDSVKASNGKEVIKRKLLAGELDNLVDQVLDLSGYNDEAEDIEDLKNS